MLLIAYVFLGVVVLSAIVIFRRATPQSWRRIAIALVFLSACLGLYGVILSDQLAFDTPEWRRMMISQSGFYQESGAKIVRDVACRFIPLLFLSLAVLTVAAYRRSN
jgi:hypothetical protein